MADIQRRSEEEEGIIHQQEENQSLLIRKQDEEINGEEGTRKKKKKKRKTSRKAKLATLFSSPFTKLKKLSTNSSNSTNLNSPSTNPFPDSGNIEINSCYMCCGFTKKKKKDLGSSPISSDPNSPNFSYDLCKALIEKNDFFSKQCNVHLDIS